MTEHIDLGDELADWSEPTRDPRQKPEQPVHTPAPGGGAYMSLTDLQAAGFNTAPPPGYVTTGAVAPNINGPGWRLFPASAGGWIPFNNEDSDD